MEARAWQVAGEAPWGPAERGPAGWGPAGWGPVGWGPVGWGPGEWGPGEWGLAACHPRAWAPPRVWGLAVWAEGWGREEA